MIRRGKQEDTGVRVTLKLHEESPVDLFLLMLSQGVRGAFIREAVAYYLAATAKDKKNPFGDRSVTLSSFIPGDVVGALGAGQPERSQEPAPEKGLVREALAVEQETGATPHSGNPVPLRDVSKLLAEWQ